MRKALDLDEHKAVYESWPEIMDSANDVVEDLDEWTHIDMTWNKDYVGPPPELWNVHLSNYVAQA